MSDAAEIPETERTTLKALLKDIEDARTQAYFSQRFVADKLKRLGGKVEITLSEGPGVRMLVFHHVLPDGSREKVGHIPVEREEVTGR